MHDLKLCIQTIKANPGKYANKGSAAMYGMIAKIPDECIVDDFLKEFINMLY